MEEVFRPGGKRARGNLSVYFFVGIADVPLLARKKGGICD